MGRTIIFNSWKIEVQTQLPLTESEIGCIQRKIPEYFIDDPNGDEKLISFATCNLTSTLFRTPMDKNRGYCLFLNENNKTCPVAQRARSEITPEELKTKLTQDTLIIHDSDPNGPFLKLQ